MCTSEQVRRYRSRISGPLLDRIDLHVEVARTQILPYRFRGKKPECSETVRQRVILAREIQLTRAGLPNAQLENDGVRRYCKLNIRNQKFLEEAIEHMGFSGRACQRILKVARTVADLEFKDKIGKCQLAEAMAYRGIDCGKNQG
jgi:magnesium chelatase family protein